jgi:predicted RNA-binding Zn-ribbon protein involved in translation (DUF1610 family)
MVAPPLLFRNECAIIEKNVVRALCAKSEFIGDSMENNIIGTCVECGSEFLKSKSKMEELCPECAYWLYGYENCKHIFKDGKCTICLWNGNKSDYIKSLSDKL